MKIIDCIQGSPEWLDIRLAIPTASCFDQILTPRTLKLSASAAKYRNQLLAEYLCGYPIDFGGQSQFMDRGTELEPEARAFYEMQYDAEVRQVGFVMRDDERVGGSPDGLVGMLGGVEIKCPALHTMIGYLLDPTTLVADYRGQVQGLLYLTGRAWWDVIAYSPALPHVCQRVERDGAYITALDLALATFLADLDACRETLAPYRQMREAA